jgi:two-component system NtrC family response regulator
VVISGESATNRDLGELVRQGRFRQDLFYRLQVIEIILPPLRERREDIRLLVEHILGRDDADDKVSDLPAELREMLFHYDWPGNVRELINTIQRYLATDAVSLPGHPELAFSKDASTVDGLHAAVAALEKKMIGQTLNQTNWHRGETASRLKIPRHSLQRKILKYGLQPPR